MPTLIGTGIAPWTVDYQYSVDTSVSRTSQTGFKRQAARGSRQIVIASATRLLRLAEMPYFEVFIREICLDGSLKFTDYYADYNGLVSGDVRILGGAYSVSSDTRRHIVTCELEIFR